MSRPQSILAATDFSPSANLAVEQAALLAQTWDVKLSLLYVFNDSAWASLKSVFDLPGWTEVNPAESARQRLAGWGHHIAQKYSIPVEAEVRIGRASRQIGEAVASQQAGLLVVGEHGEDWVSDVVLGGTALKVLEAARIPVLLVRRAEPALYRDIIVATDFSPAAGRAARFALDCFPSAHLALVHAWQLPFESSMRMGGAREEDIAHYREREFGLAASGLEAFVRECEGVASSGRFERLVLHGSPEAVLFEQAHARGSDLIAIGKHGGKPLDERLLGSVTQNILYHAKCDVLLSP